MHAGILGGVAVLLGLWTMTDARTYTTSFPNTENPISESGNWVNGETTGLDWSNISTSASGARGQQTPDGAIFDDATALLTGTWGPDQDASAVVRDVSTHPTAAMEIEIRLRSTMTAHSSTGYEVYWSIQSGNPYLNIARWNGALGSYVNIAQATSGVLPADGDTVRATIVGTVITAYINGVQKLQYNTSGDAVKYTTGNPGFGFFLQGTGGNPAEQANYGFSSFTVTDGVAPTSVPTVLRVVR